MKIIENHGFVVFQLSSFLTGSNIISARRFDGLFVVTEKSVEPPRQGF